MSKKQFYRNFPDTPGVYLMKDKAGKILYVGKAANLKRRVSSYFERPHHARIQKLVSEIATIEYEKKDTAIEALIREAELIKSLTPPYNIKDKDDKSFLFVGMTKEPFPRVILVRGKRQGETRFSRFYGPFTSASSIREALRILRRIFPWNVHTQKILDGWKSKRGCLDYELGLCPGTCIGVISKKEYAKTIANLKLFFKGEKKRVIKAFTREMESTSKSLDFEQAARLRGRIFALQHIRDVAVITEDVGAEYSSSNPEYSYRIEGYDISNISGTSATGSMVVFVDGKSDTNEYRKFKIQTLSEPNDVGMMKEMLHRRFGNPWRLPDLILVDGGKPQISAAKQILDEFSLQIPVIGIVKGPERKRNDIIGLLPKGVLKETLISVRDEAHRFAIIYHKRLRSANFFKK